MNFEYSRLFERSQKSHFHAISYLCPHLNFQPLSNIHLKAQPSQDFEIETVVSLQALLYELALLNDKLELQNCTQLRLASLQLTIKCSRVYLAYVDQPNLLLECGESSTYLSFLRFSDSPKGFFCLGPTSF